MPARRVSTPGEAPASRPWGKDEEAPGTSLQQKKLLKKLAVSADVPRPAGEGWGQRRTPDTYNQRAGYGERGKRRSSSASREAQPRQRGEQPSSRGSRGAPELPPAGRGQAVTEGGDALGRVQREAERWHRPRAAPRRHPLPSAPRARPRDTVTY